MKTAGVVYPAPAGMMVTVISLWATLEILSPPSSLLSPCGFHVNKTSQLSSRPSSSSWPAEGSSVIVPLSLPEAEL